MRPGTHGWLMRDGIGLVLVALLVLLFPVTAKFAGLGLGLVLVVLIILGYLVFVVGMPFFAWIMGEAGYRVLLKPYVRAWRINRIRNARLLRETLTRGRHLD